MTAADDNNFCGWGESGEGFGGDRGCEGTEVVLAILWMLVSMSSRGRGSGWEVYATEEMAYEYDENPARSILVVGIQALECILPPVLVQHGQVGDLLEVLLGRGVVIDLDVTLDVARRVFDGHFIERGGRIFADSINPEDERDESECQ